MKNRNIEKDEINKIIEHCPIREKAFFTIMIQSGLTPRIIKELRIENVEKILELDTPIPCKISIPAEKIPTFIGYEAVNYLKEYLRVRTDNLTRESLLFIVRNKPNKEINTKDESRIFSRIAKELKRQRKITYVVREGKPSELRLFSLVNFYRKNAKKYLAQLNNNHTPKEDELYRKQYEEIAMSDLEIEPLTNQVRRLTKQYQKLERKLVEIEKNEYPEDEYGKWLEEHPEEAKKMEEERRKDMKTHEKWRKEHPEEARLEDEKMERKYEEIKEYIKYCEEHDKELRIEYLENKVKEWENRFTELENIVKRKRKISA